MAHCRWVFLFLAEFSWRPIFEFNLSFAETGFCHLWDLRATETQHTFQDEGSFHGTVLNISPNEQFLACGSNTGIVNVYETSAVSVKQNPKPMYVLENLTTSADFLKFNHNSEMLAFGSEDKVTFSNALIRYQSTSGNVLSPSSHAIRYCVQELSAYSRDDGKGLLHLRRLFTTFWLCGVWEYARWCSVISPQSLRSLLTCY
jgi:WD40 repeat protein